MLDISLKKTLSCSLATTIAADAAVDTRCTTDYIEVIWNSKEKYLILFLVTKLIIDFAMWIISENIKVKCVVIFYLFVAFWCPD